MNDDDLAARYPRGQEHWRAIPGFEGRYDVSSLGSVRSVTRDARRAPGPRLFNGSAVTLVGKVLRAATMKSGHKFVMLGRGNGRLVHRLVLLAFVGPCPDGKEALHRNDVPGDNWVGNLRWGTRAENIEDAFNNGGRVRSKNPDPRVGKRKQPR